MSKDQIHEKINFWTAGNEIALQQRALLKTPSLATSKKSNSDLS